MHPTMTMTITTATDGADAPEIIKEIAKSEILNLTPKERAELLAMIKLSRCEQ